MGPNQLHWEDVTYMAVKRKKDERLKGEKKVGIQVEEPRAREQKNPYREELPP